MDKQPPSGRGRGGWPRFRGRGRNFRPYFRKRQPQVSQNDASAVPSVASSPVNASSASNKTGPTQKEITCFTLSPCPYLGWKLYFPSENYSVTSVNISKTQAFTKYIEKNGPLFPVPTIEKARAFSVDVKVLAEDAEFISSWPDFKSDLTNEPSTALGCLGLAMHQAIATRQRRGNDSALENCGDPVNLPMIWARVRNHEPILPLTDLKSKHYGKLVTVRGTVVRVGCGKLIVTSMAFECKHCQTLLCVLQPDGILTEPSKCTASGCKSTDFVPLRSSPFTASISLQQMRVQEVQRDQGRVPPVVDCTLTADLTEKWCPGDVVTVTGIVKISGEEIKTGASHTVPVYIKVVSVTNNKSQTGTGPGEQFNLKDYYAIKEIHSEPKLFRLLVHSLNPAIYGHELVKAGLLLGLFGGSENENARSDSHILVVGDPGLGKSQMLQACANIAPKGVYVCGHVSSSSGLTLTVKKEGGDYSLEAGALVMADEGVCCIDEFDKMTHQHYALLDAMEDQKVTIAKHGVVCSMPARCSILAAANPVGGHYNKAKTVSENLKLGPALLSRFDLVFVLLDQPNKFLDVMLSDHVMGMHSGVKSSSRASHSSSRAAFSDSQSSGPLQQQLKLLPGEELDVIPPQLIRKYIAYARKYVKPILSKEAALVLRGFFLDLRRQHQGGDSTPVTTRQLESLIRLSQARAKIELREVVTINDAKEIVEIFRTSLIDTWTDEVGNLDLSRSIHGSGMSSRNVAKKFVSILQNRADVTGQTTFTTSEMKEIIKSASLNVPDFSNFVSSLNLQGVMLKKDGKFILELSHRKEGDKDAWVPVPKKTVWPSGVAASTASFSASDDTSSVQLSPWQRDHCWKQSAPRRLRGTHPTFFMKPLPTAFHARAAHRGALRKLRRRPHDPFIPPSTVINGWTQPHSKSRAKACPSRLTSTIQRIWDIVKSSSSVFSPRKRILREMERVSLVAEEPVKRQRPRAPPAAGHSKGVSSYSITSLLRPREEESPYLRTLLRSPSPKSRQLSPVSEPYPSMHPPYSMYYPFQSGVAPSPYMVPGSPSHSLWTPYPLSSLPRGVTSPYSGLVPSYGPPHLQYAWPSSPDCPLKREDNSSDVPLNLSKHGGG